MSIFTKIKAAAVPRSKFNLSHDVKFSGNIGYLYPLLCQDIVPGDKWKIDGQLFVRFAPMFAPILQRMDMYCHYFFVPYRLIWDDFEEFISPKGDGTGVAPEIPYHANAHTCEAWSRYFGPGTLGDFLGLPSLQFKSSSELLTINFVELPFRAYNLIYNEYYRDENVVPEVEISKSSGAQRSLISSNFFKLKRRSWAKDYFTSALPWVQRGADVSLPLTGDADVYLKTSDGTQPFPYQGVRVFQPGDGWLDSADNLELGTHRYSSTDINTPPNALSAYNSTDVAQGLRAAIDPNGTLAADMSGVTAATINELRECIALQHWQEISARSGARYKEMLWGHFHVMSKDARLDRPEFLGGGRAPIQISETFQTSNTKDEDAHLGYMAGNAAGYGSKMSMKHYFDEHGLLMAIVSFRPRASYMQGIPRYYMKKSRFDFYWPSFANLGEQPIANNEIFYDPSNEFTTDPQQPFGYTPRYAEYKFINSSVHGKFLTDLDYWHLGRKFANQPLLNQSFLEVSGQDRIFHTTDAVDDHLYCQMFFNIDARRPMPKFGTPSII